MGTLFFSHRLDVLAQHLFLEIVQDGRSPLVPRIVLVPSGTMKQWLLIQFANWSEQRGIAGCKIFTLDEGLQFLFGSSSGFTEVFCSIFTELANCRDSELEEYLSKGLQDDLAYHLTTLFLKYGDDGQLLSRQIADSSDWQERLFKKLLESGKLRLRIQNVVSSSDVQGPIHCFGFDFLPPFIWEHWVRCGVSVYLFSPCRHFWADLCTDHERRRLDQYWKGRGISFEKREELGDYLREAPPLLANWGKLGRETLKILDQFEWRAQEDDASKENDSVLGRVKQRLLDFAPLEQMNRADRSIRICKAGFSRFMEVEQTRHLIMQLVHQEKIPFSEICVLAPDIQPYAPLIELLFSDLPYRISNVERGAKSFMCQGMRRLFHLLKDRWTAEDLLILFENPSFCRALPWDAESLKTFRTWLLHQKHDDFCQERLINQLIYCFPEEKNQITVGSIEQVEQWVAALQSLKDDLALFQTDRSPADWSQTLLRFVQKYLFFDRSDEADAAYWNFFQKLTRDLAQVQEEQALFPFSAIQKILQKPVAGGEVHSSHLHAIRFGSFEEGELIPSRALFLMGMDEEFPRCERKSSLDLLRQEKGFFPKRADVDRYLFLRALFAAKEFFILSYRSLSDEGRKVNPSVLIEELRSGLDTPILEESVRSVSNVRGDFFPWPSKPSLPLPEGNFVIPLSELLQLSRHPWKFYLQKQYGIYVKDRDEESFSREKALLLREGLYKPMGETTVSGIFGQALKMQVLEVAQTRAEQMESWGAVLEPIALRLSCEQRKRNEQGWQVPALEFSLENSLHIKITGEIKSFSSKGFIHTGDDSLDGLLKVWPECLAALIALNHKEICFLKTGAVKRVEHPEEEMKKFLTYYFHSLSAPSPLLSEWADAMLRKDVAAWNRKVDDRMAEKKVRFEDPVFDWVRSRASLPSSERWFEDWSALLKRSFSGLMALYPSRGKNAAI